MKTGLFLLPSLAAVCYSAALPKEDNGDILKRDSEDYTLTVFVTAAPQKASVVKTITQQNQGQGAGGVYVTITKTLTTNPVGVKKTTTSKKATTTVRYGNTPVVTVYRTVTTAKPVTVYITTDGGDDNSDDGDDNGDDNGDDGGDNGNRKRQVWLDPFTTTDYYTPDDPQPTDGDWGDWSGWGAQSTTTVYYDEDVSTTTVWGETRRHHRTTVWAPRQTEWAKREAAPQTDEFDIGDASSTETYGGDVEEPVEFETPDVEETDNKKRQILFTVTDDLNYPIETETSIITYLPTSTRRASIYRPSSTRRVSTYRPASTRRASTYRPASTRRPKTTDLNGPYGSWYPTATGRYSVATYNTRYTYNPYNSISTYSPYYPVSTDTPDQNGDDSNGDDSNGDDSNGDDSNDDDSNGDDSNGDDPNDDSKVTKRQVTFENDDSNDDDNSDDSTTETFNYNNGDDNGDDNTDTTIYTVPTVLTTNSDDGQSDDSSSDDSSSDDSSSDDSSSDDSSSDDSSSDDYSSDLETDNKKRAISPACNKRGIQNVDFPCEQSITSLIVKPTGLVEVSISRTIIQAGVSMLLTSSSSSSSVAQTTFATSVRARVDIRN